MRYDSIFDYLRSCNGQDFLEFGTAEKASKARTVLLDRLDDEGIDIDKRPKIEQFDTQLRLRLKDFNHVAEPTEQVAEVH